MIERCSFEKYEKNIEKVKELFPFLEIAKESYGESLCNEEEIQFDKSADVLVIYGISVFAYSKLERWLKDGKNLIFLEDEKEAFSLFLQTSLAEKILEDERVSIYFLEGDYILKKIAWENVFLKIKLHPSHLYFCQKKERFLEIENKLNEMVLGALLSFSNYHDFGHSSLLNTFQNLLSLKTIHLISDLKNSFQNIPAVICGAGPSLEKSLPLLKQMQDKALLFAGGSALSILSKNDVHIHFSAAIDKNAEEKKNTYYETVFFHSLQVSHDFLKNVHGDKFLVKNDALPLENFFFESFLNEEKLDTGWTVATFLLSIAHFLGCSPIYFTGLDFCFTKKKYGGGLNEDGSCDIETKDVFGNRVFTQKDWMLAVSWIEDFSKEALLVNANGGGLKIKVKEGPLDLLSKNLDLKGLVHSKISRVKYIPLEKKMIAAKLDDIEKSALECLNILELYMQELEKDFSEGLFEKDYAFENFEKELFFNEHLLPLWNIYSYVIKRKLKNENKKDSPPLHFLVYLNKLLFFKNVVEDFLTLGSQWKNMK